MIKRRDFIAGLGSAVVFPAVVRAQQSAMPVVGYLTTGLPEEGAASKAAFLKGLSETGYVDGRNTAIEYRHANNENDRLPELAADFVRRRVAVIAAPGSTAAPLAAKTATSTIPIVFSIGSDPVKLGFVVSLNRPGGNLTGMSFLATDTVAKMLEMVHRVAPKGAVIAALVNPDNPDSEAVARDAQKAASVLGLELHVLNAHNERDIDTAFAILRQRRAEALLIQGDPFFTHRMKNLVVLTARHAMPAIYPQRDFPDAGGLLSYGASRIEGAHLVGVYVGRILNGEKPADLPVQQSVKFELVINLKTAKALGLTIPETLLATADEVIE